MKKILAPIVLLFVLALGGNAYANYPRCSAVCSCTMSCADARNVLCYDGLNTNCANYGMCIAGGRCNSAPPLELALAMPIAAKPAVCTAGDDPFAAADGNCAPSSTTVAMRPLQR